MSVSSTIDNLKAHTDDSVILYKSQMYRGSMIMDAGFYYAPYRPGMTAEELYEVQMEQAKYSGPTELQNQIMDVVRHPQVRS
jgi:hypothetical protein